IKVRSKQVVDWQKRLENEDELSMAIPVHGITVADLALLLYSLHVKLNPFSKESTHLSEYSIYPCQNYRFLNDSSRSVYAQLQSSLISDEKLNNSWYRFNGGQDSQAILTKCVETYGKCGSLSPGWMRGKHPQVGDGIVNRTACFYFFSDCCAFKASIQVKNCRAFIVYRLPSTSLLPISSRYCTKQLDRCDPNPCINNGVCNKSRDDYTCTCAANYTGKNCEIDLCNPNPCFNSGICNRLKDDYTCTCIANYTGKNCEKDIDPCRRQPCVNGFCLRNNYSYHCLCLSGYTGQNCEQDIDECQDEANPCQEICVNTLGSYRCDCKVGNILLSNKECYDPCKNHTQIIDKTRSIDWDDKSQIQSDHDRMNNTWYRFNADISSQMLVTYPTSMLQCGAISPGWLASNHPHVSQGITVGTVCFAWANSICRWNRTIHIKNCKHFFTYRLPSAPNKYQRYCTANFDYCDPNPCVNASCLRQSDDFYCKCRSGFTGKRCQLDINECHANPCKYGSCINLSPGYQCMCDTGYTGNHCQYDINECQQQNGNCSHICINTLGSYYCKCPTGFYHQNSNRCLDPCSTYQTMKDSTRLLTNTNLIPMRCDENNIESSWYRLTSYVGVSFMLPTHCPTALRCQTSSPGWINGSHPRVEDGIVNRTVCFNWNNNCCFKTHDIMVKNCKGYHIYYLSSLTRYQYPTCSRYCTSQINPCDPNPCKYGKCNAENFANFTCQCLPGYGGKLCDQEINECSSNPCYTGKCIDLINNYTCQCPQGITGPNCDTDVNECLQNNGGCSQFCHNTFSSYSCSCSNDFELQADNHNCFDPCSIGHISFNNTFTQAIDIATLSNINHQCHRYTTNNEYSRWYQANLQDNCKHLTKWVNNTQQQDFCSSSPCQHGQCQSTATGYECTCFNGYHGLNCQYEGNQIVLGVNPCLFNPCLRGECLVTSNSSYSCRCFPFYTGNHCQTELIEKAVYCRTRPNSCLELAKQVQNKKLINQYYDIYDTNTCDHQQPKKWRVYCDFNSQPGYAWTLIESFSLANSRHSKINRAFTYNSPINHQRSQVKWSLYRIGRPEMLHIFNRNRDSSSGALWRATCNFNSLSLPLPANPVDYMQGSFYRKGGFDFLTNIEGFDILQYRRDGDCRNVDYLNIRGNSYRGKRFQFWASGSYHLVIDSFHTRCDGITIPRSVKNEHNFGLYAGRNTQFTCSSDSSSITSWWIGAKVK
ncbi:Neurogenic locus notch-like protein 1, partial [Trichoplax sp. H2]